MWIISVLVLFAGGLLGAANRVVARRPNARELIDKLRPYQGLIGIVLLIWGVLDLIRLIRHAPQGSASLGWVVSGAVAITELGLGFLLGFEPLRRYLLSPNPKALERGERLREKLSAYQAPLGMAAMILAVVYMILILTQ